MEKFIKLLKITHTGTKLVRMVREAITWLLLLPKVVGNLTEIIRLPNEVLNLTRPMEGKLRHWMSIFLSQRNLVGPLLMWAELLKGMILNRLTYLEVVIIITLVSRKQMTLTLVREEYLTTVALRALTKRTLIVDVNLLIRAKFTLGKLIVILSQIMDVTHTWKNPQVYRIREIFSS